MTRAVQQRTTLWKLGGGASLFFGLCFVAVVAFAPSKPGDQGVMVGIGVFAGFLVIAGAALFVIAGKQAARIRTLLLEQRGEIAGAKVIQMQRGPRVLVFAVHITDKAGKLYGVMVPSEADAKRLASYALERGA